MSAAPPAPASRSTVAPAPAVASPCTNICRMNAASGYCDGCQRSIDEIVAWTRLDDAGKRAVLAQLPARRAANQPPA